MDNEVPELNKEKTTPVSETSADTSAESTTTVNSNSVSNKESNKSSNKTLLIVIVLVVLCFCCISVVGAIIFAGNLANQGLGNIVTNQAESTIKNEIEKSIEKSLGGPDADIDLGLIGKAEIPDGFPSDVSIYPNAKVTSSTKIKSSSSMGHEYTLVLTVDNVSPMSVLGFYKTSLESNGWVEDQDLNFGSFYSRSYSKDSRTVVISATQINNDTTIVLAVS